MSEIYACHSEGRRQAVRDSASLNGIDYLEVVTADQRTLAVHFLHPVPGQGGAVPAAGPALTRENFLIAGGERIKSVRVTTAAPTASGVVTLTVDAPGDFSTYELLLVSSPTQPDPPAGFDPQLAAVPFSFKSSCPSPFDCKTETVCPTPRRDEPEIDYLAKDYASFRRLLLDRLSVLVPDWRERNPADVQVALVELLAYVADHLSYYQDAVATEAYLGTARRRISVRRHARALDYFVHDGVNARAWVALEVGAGSPAEGAPVPAGTRLLSRVSGPGVRVAPADLVKALAEGPAVFETLHSLVPWSAHNRIELYTWSDAECCLAKGATRATLLNAPPLKLAAGDVLIFEEVISPTHGTEADADPLHRHAVRLLRADAAVDPLDGTKVMEVEWSPVDALPFPLCVTARVPGGVGLPEVATVSVARGNVVLADHGLTLAGESLLPPAPAEGVVYRPRLRAGDLAFAVPYEDAEARARPAAAALGQDPRRALPAILLAAGNEEWTARRDLLASDRFAADFVVETERDGSATLRFGDGVMGKAPTAGVPFVATYRVGGGRLGNVGAGALSRIVSPLAGFERVRNLLPAAGGGDPESLEEVRQYAPQAFRVQERAVTEADWAEVAQRTPEVQRAAATLRWTGSWYTAFLPIDRAGGSEVDPGFRQALRRDLERYRLAGYDLEIQAPVFLPLDIQLRVCVAPGYFRSDVHQALLQVFGRGRLPDGRLAFFHPDNFTFGQPVYLSRLYEAALGVAGVASVEVLRFQRLGSTTVAAIAGELVPAALEIVRLDNDPNFPENGRIDFDLRGGL